ncbi:hypothetical protein HMPREF0298_2272 [Corynebacterium lipophiloflavum DSM 44291]|uniref:N-acetyltransferase domain-containing protein n=1 Tax=Corynebacterium lipophiloflavum (strain ATCC 700352 / DSM 44291 / CCUG 37336 / JCM 10383 / DMMZ 1944) TaxID=525263 RepID=C0XV02_CORLD|nr:hypothetical protein HMPREF0298_2272 [Corynebacterium lipophiloflavum DSM 44291]
MEFTLRPARESDRTYIQRLNYLTEVFGDESAPLSESSLRGVNEYVDQWDPLRDGGVIAFDPYRTPAGGVWLRHWASPEQGFANLCPDVPELAIAVENRFAGHALGTRCFGPLATSPGPRGRGASPCSSTRTTPGRGTATKLSGLTTPPPTT